MKGLALRNTHVKYERPKFELLERSNSKVKDQIVKVMISKERSCQKEYTCEI
jgi:hypothetical protein